MNDQSIEQEIQAKGLTAPRITPADIEANIAFEHYFVASQAPLPSHDYPKSLDLLTFCVLVLKNGFTVHGVSACASPENFNAEIGRKIARENAINEVWPLMGYELRSKLADKEREKAKSAERADVDRRLIAINRGDDSAKFSDDELNYSAFARCMCGAGLAYPKNIGFDGAWHCADILTFRAAKSNEPGAKSHDMEKPFAFYDIKSENQPSAYGATTRPTKAGVDALDMTHKELKLCHGIILDTKNHGVVSVEAQDVEQEGGAA